MKDGFLKAAAFSPALRVADCTYNAQQILADVQAAFFVVVTQKGHRTVFVQWPFCCLQDH